MARLANLLGLSVDEAEKHVSDMVSDSGLYAKIDRPQGIIVFAKPQSPDEVLQDSGLGHLEDAVAGRDDVLPHQQGDDDAQEGARGLGH